MELTNELAGIYNPIEAELQAVEKKLYDLIPHDLEPISTVEKYIIDNGGKRLRPALVLLSSKIAFSTHEVLKPAFSLGAKVEPGKFDLPSRTEENGESGSSLPDIIITFAAIAEIIHTATLVHDDLMTGSLLRRGHKTVNSGWGNEVAVLLGDHLYLKAIELLTSEDIFDPDGSKYSRKGHQASNLIFQTMHNIFKGEVLQYQKHNRLSMTEEEYFSIIQGKSASFTSSCCKIGALLDENTYPGVEESLASYGLNLGIAFQIRDDILDLMGSEEGIGKEVGSDVREGRMTLPIIHLMANIGNGDRKHLESILRSLSGKRLSFPNRRHLKRIRKMLLNYGSIAYSLDMANRFADIAEKELEMIPDSTAKQSLLALAHYVITRGK